MWEINYRLSGGKKEIFYRKARVRKKINNHGWEDKEGEINAYRTRIYNIKGDLFAVLLQWIMVFLDLHLPVWCLVPIVILRLFYVTFNSQKMWIMTIVEVVKNLSKNVVIKTVSNKYIWYVYSDRRDKEVNQRVNVWSNKKRNPTGISHT